MANDDDETPRPAPPRHGRARRSEDDFDEIKDDRVRGFLLRGSFSVNSIDDWRIFADRMALLHDLWEEREESRKIRQYLLELYNKREEDAAFRVFLKGRYERASLVQRNRTKGALWVLGLVAGGLITGLITSYLPGVLQWLTGFFR